MNMKPHNPDNLLSPGEGYRFLDKDEITIGPHLREIELWNGNKWVAFSYAGGVIISTYRTRLSRIELACLRRANGDQKLALSLLRGHYRQDAASAAIAEAGPQCGTLTHKITYDHQRNKLQSANRRGRWSALRASLCSRLFLRE